MTNTKKTVGQYSNCVCLGFDHGYKIIGIWGNSSVHLNVIFDNYTMIQSIC